MEKPASDTSPTPSRGWGNSPVKPQAHVSRPTAFLLPEGQQSQEALAAASLPLGALRVAPLRSVWTWRPYGGSYGSRTSKDQEVTKQSRAL